MSKLPDVAPCPDQPALQLKRGALCVAAPQDLDEACFSVPAIRALKHARPEDMIAILCKESQMPLWQTVDQVDRVIGYAANASSRQIARSVADADTVFESSIVWEAGESAKAMARAGIEHRLGYPAKGLEKHLTEPVELVITPGPVEHRVRHYLDLIEKLGVEAYIKENFSPPALESAPSKLKIVVAPASDMGESYQWPVEKFVEVIQSMNKHHGEIDWMILGDGASGLAQARCSELKDLLGDVAEDVLMQWDDHQLLTELPKCSALLACDNYTAHLAAHVGLPAAVIFGPNEPDWKRPLGKQSRVIRNHVACSPCFLAKCPLDMRCQEQVTVEKVVSELERALALRHTE